MAWRRVLSFDICGILPHVLDISPWCVWLCSNVNICFCQMNFILSLSFGACHFVESCLSSVFALCFVHVFGWHMLVHSPGVLRRY